MEKLTMWKKEINKSYLGSWDLCIGADDKDQPIYKEMVVTISKVEKSAVPDMEGIKKGNANATKDEILVYFKELDKPMIVHAKTNFNGLEKATGTPFIERWISKTVCVYVEKGVKAFGVVTDALRIKPKPTRICDVCGNIMENDLYEKTKSAYGKAICSKTCKEKAKIV